MHAKEVELDCGLTVNDVVIRWPATIAVFNRFGIDTCCGGMVSVEDAARREGVEARSLCDALQAAVSAAA